MSAVCCRAQAGAIRIYGLPLLNKNGHQRAGERGPLYEARLGSADGPVLVASTVQPLLDGARVLHGAGHYRPG